MKLIVNGESKTVSDQTSVDMLLNELGLTTQRIAVEVNEEIIPRSDLKQHILKNGDIVEVIKAIGGG